MEALANQKIAFTQLVFPGRKINPSNPATTHSQNRLLSLDRNLLKNEAKARLYDKGVMGYEKNGWARPLTVHEVNANDKLVYNPPHHGVYHPEKVLS